MGRSCVAVDLERPFKPIQIALLTVSDTRTLETDTSGDLLAERIKAAGHHLLIRAIEKDDALLLVQRLENWIDDPEVDCVITTGGTGLTGRDVTPEALEKVRATYNGKDIPGTSTVQSRAIALVANGTYVFALPGSNGAVKDGWDGILKEQLDSRNRPCNFVELMPRLKEV